MITGLEAFIEPFTESVPKMARLDFPYAWKSWASCQETHDVFARRPNQGGTRGDKPSLTDSPSIDVVLDLHGAS